MGNTRSVPIPWMAFARLEGAWAVAAGVQDRPAVVADGPVVADVSLPARAAGLRPGIRVQSARRLLSSLEVVPRDAIDPMAALEPFYEALLSLSPRVEPVVDHLAAFCELDPQQTVDGVVAILQAAGLERYGHRLVLGLGHGRLVARMAARVAARSPTGGGAGATGRQACGSGPLSSRTGPSPVTRPPAGPAEGEAGAPRFRGGTWSWAGRGAWWDAEAVGRDAAAQPGSQAGFPAGRGGPAGGHPSRARPPREACGAAGLAVVSCCVPPGQEAGFLAPLPVAALQEEVPPAARRQLQRLGLYTLGDVAAAPRQVVARAVGDQAPLLQAWCRGDDRRPLKPGFPPPGVTATLTAPPELGDELRAGWWPAQLPLLARDVAARLAAAGQAGRLVILQGERSRVGRYLPVAAAGQDVLARAALALYHRLVPAEPAPARLDLTVTALEPAARQLALPAAFDPGAGPGGRRAVPGSERPGTGRQRAGRAPFPAGQEVAGPELPVLLDELARRYPGRIFWGRERPATRRERQLAYWDPWRGAPGQPGR